MKKKTLFKEILTIVLVFGFIFVFMVGCSGSSPKSLAKQTYNLYQEIEKAGDDPVKVLKLTTKIADLEKKVEKLSDSDSDIYEEELLKLMLE